MNLKLWVKGGQNIEKKAHPIIVVYSTLIALFFSFLGMFCRACRQHKPVKNGPKIRPFVEVGAVQYRKDYLERHITTEHHQHSMKCYESLASGNNKLFPSLVKSQSHRFPTGY